MDPTVLKSNRVSRFVGAESSCPATSSALQIPAREGRGSFVIRGVALRDEAANQRFLNAPEKTARRCFLRILPRQAKKGGGSPSTRRRGGHEPRHLVYQDSLTVLTAGGQ